jgi:ABC-2 type transport system ATP-binding protein
MTLIEVQGLEKSFSRGFIPKKVKILKSISFNVMAGRVTGFLGGNGAGKTTTLKCILGLIFPDAGDIRILGEKMESVEIRRKLGFLPERAYFYEHLTGEEFLKFHGELAGTMKSAEVRGRVDELLNKVDLNFARHKRLRDYSKGMLQKIGMAQAILHRPSLVILDEPMSGLDPDGRYYVSQLIQETASEGTGVFFSSHLLPDLEKISHDLVILKEGEVLYNGSLKGFLSSVEQKFSIKYLRQGNPAEVRPASLDQLQAELAKLIGEKATVLSVSSQSHSLEEVFISKAQKVQQ